MNNNIIIINAFDEGVVTLNNVYKKTFSSATRLCKYGLCKYVIMEN